MAKFKFTEEILNGSRIAARLGSDTKTNGGNLTDTEVGKLCKLAGDSRYDLCAVGDKIGGRIVGVESATVDDYSIGTVQLSGRIVCTCEGDEATGTGTIAVGDYVVAGTSVAKGTALGSAEYPKVRKATNQPGAAIDVGSTVDQTSVNAALAKAVDQTLNAATGWKVVSVGTDGSVGDTCVIERVDYNLSE